MLFGPTTTDSFFVCVSDAGLVECETLKSLATLYIPLWPLLAQQPILSLYSTCCSLEHHRCLCVARDPFVP